MLRQISPAQLAILSIAAAVTTIVLKGFAYWITGSVGLLSDALESGVNLVAAVIALLAILIAARPPDDEHAYGHTKAEYFASGVEGTLIVLAAVTIIGAAINRLLFPRPLEEIGLGVIVTVVATVLNLGVARILKKGGELHHSVALMADGDHLLADVWTSVGVIVGVVAAALTGWSWLDPLTAILVAAHILAIGSRILRESALGLMDTALPEADLRQIEAILQGYQPRGATYHALRTRQSGVQRFVSVHIQVPGSWSVQQGHILLEEIEEELRRALPRTSILTHLEPIEDPVSWHDIELNR